MWDLESTKRRCVAWSITIPGKWSGSRLRCRSARRVLALGYFWVSVFGMFRIRLKSSDTKGAQLPSHANHMWDSNFWDCGYCGLRENWVPQTWFFIIIFPWKQQFWCIRSQTPTYRRSATWWCRQPPRGASAVKLHPAVRTAEWPGKAMESWGYQGLLVGFWLICLVNFGRLLSTAWLKIKFGQEMARAYLYS